MANYKDCPVFNTHNDYYTPKSAWENIQHLITKDKIIYECFMLNSNEQSKQYLHDKPFIILINSTNTLQKWYKELVIGKDIKFIFTSKKINYDKYEEGGIKKIEQKKNACSFNAIYMTYKILDKNEWI